MRENAHAAAVRCGSGRSSVDWHARSRTGCSVCGHVRGWRCRSALDCALMRDVPRTGPAALYPLRGGGYLWARSGCCARLARVPAVAGSPSGDDAAPSMNRFVGERGWRHGWQAMSMNGRRPGVAVGWPPAASRAVGKKLAGAGRALRRRQVPEEEICSGTGGRTAVRSAAAAPARCTTACASREIAS
jgi:hypothetical protein